MILKEDKKEIDAIQEVCAIVDMKCNFYTIENNDQIIQIEILDHLGEEPSAEIAYRIGKMVVIKLEMLKVEMLERKLRLIKLEMLNIK